jgi:hypothetical protein
MSETVKICSDENTNTYLGLTLDCSDTCFQEDRKIIIEEKKCVKECEFDEHYKLEYKEICYKECPESTFNLSYKCENCFYKCKNCSGYGDENNNNCSECKPGMILLNDFNKSNCYNICDFYYYFDDNGNYICTQDSECPEGYTNLSNQFEKKCVKEPKIEKVSTFMTTYNHETSEVKVIEENETSIIKEEITDKEIAKKDEEVKNFKENMIKK